MPNVLVHTVLADRTLERWTATASAPFDSTDSRCRAAFVHGALGPDLGYFPGGYLLLSEVAHRLRTGRMAARLLANAHSEIELAFACGWITHLLLDARIHPLVELEAARLVRSESGTASPHHGSGPRSPVDIAHIRVEVGLDAVFLDRIPSIGRRLPAVFDTRSLGFLARSFREVYGIEVSREELRRAHQSVAEWHRCLVPLVRWMTADWSQDGRTAGRVVAPLLRGNDGGWLRSVGAGPVAAAFVSPVRPSPEFEARVQQEIHGLAGDIDSAVRRPGLLPDLDMEDGRPIVESNPKPSTARTLAALEQRARKARLHRWSYSEMPLNPTMNETVMSAIRSIP